MSVGIVTYEFAMLKPHNAVGIESFLQLVFDFCFVERLISVWGKQTACGGEDSAFTIGFDATSFKYKVVIINERTIKGVLCVQIVSNLVVFLSLELFAPAIEFEIEQQTITIFVF